MIMESKVKNSYNLQLIIFSSIIVCLCGIIVYLINEKNKQSVYVIADNGRFTAKPTSDNKLFQHDIKNHTKLFVKSFFEYDKYTFTQNIESALGLVDESTGKMIYKSLKDAGIYETLKEKKVRTAVRIDTLLVDMSQKPVKVKVLFRQYVYINDVVQENPVGALFDLVPFSRSEGNPFGQLIVNFKYINYTPTAQTRSLYFKTYIDLKQELEQIQQPNENQVENEVN